MTVKEIVDAIVDEGFSNDELEEIKDACDEMMQKEDDEEE